MKIILSSIACAILLLLALFFISVIVTQDAVVRSEKKMQNAEFAYDDLIARHPELGE